MLQKKTLYILCNKFLWFILLDCRTKNICYIIHFVRVSIYNLFCFNTYGYFPLCLFLNPVNKQWWSNLCLNDRLVSVIQWNERTDKPKWIWLSSLFFKKYFEIFLQCIILFKHCIAKTLIITFAFMYTDAKKIRVEKKYLQNKDNYVHNYNII